MNVAFIKEVGLGRWVLRNCIRQFFKRVARRDHYMRLPTGRKFLLPITSRFATEAFVTGGDVDWGSESLLFSLLSGSGCFLDIGANIGYYAQYMGPKCEVHCFEPDPRMLTKLRRCVGSEARVHVVSKAVGAQVGLARFTLEPDGEVSHLARSGDTGTSIEVEIETVDNFVASRGLQVEAIKTDVEGYDIEVLRGSHTTMRDQRPFVLSEIAPSTELFELMIAVRYCVYAFVRQTHSREKQFRMLDRHFDEAESCTKMLLLVPAEKQNQIERLATA